MLNILIVSATEFEISDFKQKIKNNKTNLYFDKQKANIDFITTGIGSVSTSYELTKKIITKNYNLIINAGIAGYFNKKLKLGDVVNIISDSFADLGINDNGIFKSVFDIDLIDKNAFPFENGIIKNNYNLNSGLPNVSAITVNTVSGDTKNIDFLKQKYNADVETMESASVFYICKKENINFISLRSISNYVENRNKNNWKTELAIKNLNQYLSSIFKI